MKHAKDIILILGILVLGFFVWQNTIKNTDFDNKLTKLEETHTQKVDSLQSIIATLSDSITKEKQTVIELEQSEQNAKDKANRWQYSYKQLVKQTPKTLRDSLNNYKAREKVLLSENKSLRIALKQADSAKTIQYKTITKLELIISNKDSIIKHKDNLQLETVNLYDKELKSKKRKGVFKTIGGILIFIAAIVL